MRILLTGAKGFTGVHFRQAAMAAGHDLLELQSDLTDPQALGYELQHMQVDAVVHLAAISFVGHADATAFYAVNVVGSMNLLAALADLPVPPRRVLLASSANVYGNCIDSPITERQLPAPTNHYAMSKLAMEHMARTFSSRLPLLITRPFNYTGPGQAGQFLIPKLVDHFVRRAHEVELGNLSVEREFNDVRMVVNAYLRLLDKGEPGQTYNVCSGQPFSLMQVLGLLESISGHRLDVKVNPALVRSGEVHRLCGDPTRLQAYIGHMGSWSLEATLQWMLSEASNPTQKADTP